MSLEVVQKLTADVLAQTAVLNAAQKTLNDHLALVKDLERQADYHRNNNNNDDLQIVNSRLTSAYQATPGLTAKVQQETATLNNMNTWLTNAKARLTPEEKQIAVIKEQAALKEAETAATKAAASKSRSLYIIVGVVVIVIVLGVVFYLKRKKA